jgi:hypothetical protein
MEELLTAYASAPREPNEDNVVKASFASSKAGGLSLNILFCLNLTSHF